MVPEIKPMSYFGAREDLPIIKITTIHVYTNLGPLATGGIGSRSEMFLYMYIGRK